MRKRRCDHVFPAAPGRSLALCGLALLALAASGLGCGTKEAEDPHKLIGGFDDDERGDPKEEGAGGQQPKSARSAEPASKPASLAECRAAARRIEEIALELAVKDAQDDDERTELEARRTQELASDGFKARVERAAKDCVSRETPESEAVCIGKARSEMDVDRCGKR